MHERVASPTHTHPHASAYERMNTNTHERTRKRLASLTHTPHTLAHTLSLRAHLLQVAPFLTHFVSLARSAPRKCEVQSKHHRSSERCITHPHETEVNNKCKFMIVIRRAFTLPRYATNEAHTHTPFDGCTRTHDSHNAVKKMTNAE